MPQLIVVRDGRVENHVELSQITLTIGRDPSNHIALHDPLKWVSRFHAEVRYGPEGYTLVDLGTPNGMLVDGTPVRQVMLAPGVRVILGPYSLEYSEEPGFETDPGELRTVFDQNAGRLAGDSAPIRDPHLTPAGSPPPSSIPLPLPRRTKRQKQLLVFAATILVVVGVGVVSLVSHSRAPVAAPPVSAKDPPPPPLPPASNPVPALIGEARELLGRSDLAGAENRIDEALALAPTNDEARRLKDQIAERKRDSGLRRPRPSAQEVLKTDPDIPARSGETQGDYDGRASQIRSLFARASSALSSGKPEETIEHLNNLRQLQLKYQDSDKLMDDARAKAVDVQLEKAATGSNGVWTRIEETLNRAQALARPVDKQRIEVKKTELLKDNRATAHALLNVATSDHRYANNSAKLEDLRKKYQRVRELIPATDEDYKRATDGLNNIKLDGRLE